MDNQEKLELLEETMSLIVGVENMIAENAIPELKGNELTLQTTLSLSYLRLERYMTAIKERSDSKGES